jgi:two-component system nitrate/nitrite response regulator NarL
VDESQDKIRIVLVDDHALFREGMCRLLASDPGFCVVAQCDTPDEAKRIVQNQMVDVVLLDFDFGDCDCLDFMRFATEIGFRGKILLVTAGVSENQAADLIRLGIHGIFMKHNSPSLLSQAIRDVQKDKVWFAQEFLRGTLTAACSPGPSASPQFSERERQVLTRVLEGLANKEIADRLALSESSVKASLQLLFSKTGVRTRAQLVRVALEQYKDLL